MQSPCYQADLERLLSLSKATAYADLAREAERIATGAVRPHLEQGTAVTLWGYSLLRLDPHKHLGQAIDLIQKGEGLLRQHRHEAPSLVDGVLLTAGLSWQLLNKHPQAVAIFDTILAQPDADLTCKVKAGFNRAFSLYAVGHQDEALSTYEGLAGMLDALPAVDLTHSLRRDRNRIRLNIADHQLNHGRHEAADAQLNSLDQATLTPLMDASKLVSQARIAMMRDLWDQAETLAKRAYTAALEVNYTPLRVDALGVLVAVAARKNRREEQLRLVVEMASLAQAK